jgi:D-alanyl-D-alanine carboxypeptidase
MARHRPAKENARQTIGSRYGRGCRSEFVGGCIAILVSSRKFAAFSMRILVSFLLLLTMMAGNARAQAAAWAVADHATGFILESSAGTKKLQIGSLTKVAMAMVVLDWADAQKRDLNEFATVPDSAVGLNTVPGVGLRAGDRITLRDLLYAALMQSDNEAAATLAVHVGSALGGRDASVAFVAQMNALARRLGMLRTRFLNPHGLDGLENSSPFSTPEDLARLTSYAMENSAFRFYVSQKERKIAILTGGGDETQYLLRNTNELLGIESIDGVKTGSTRRAGGCVIVSAARPPESRQEGDKVIITPRRLNVIVLGSANRFGVASSLLQRGWQRYDAWAAAGRPMKGWKAPR